MKFHALKTGLKTGEKPLAESQGDPVVGAILLLVEKRPDERDVL